MGEDPFGAFLIGEDLLGTFLQFCSEVDLFCRSI